ncbi:hypothetical protein INR49_028444 [Caranx melampygus]|nr:hypothetical protein INR49_028444 [Caranx melampygus]
MGWSSGQEFTRAVYVATDIKLSHHLVNTVFRIFDEDHDGKLSHKEFIGVMKDRLHRGDRLCYNVKMSSLGNEGICEDPNISACVTKCTSLASNV